MLEQMGIAAKQASYKLAQLSSREKNRVLEKIADELEAQSESILKANSLDVADARANGLSEAMLDRLALTPARLKSIADDVRQVCPAAGYQSWRRFWRTKCGRYRVLALRAEVERNAELQRLAKWWGEFQVSAPPDQKGMLNELDEEPSPRRRTRRPRRRAPRREGTA